MTSIESKINPTELLKIVDELGLRTPANKTQEIMCNKLTAFKIAAKVGATHVKGFEFETLWGVKFVYNEIMPNDFVRSPNGSIIKLEQL